MLFFQKKYGKLFFKERKDMSGIALYVPDDGENDSELVRGDESLTDGHCSYVVTTNITQLTNKDFIEIDLFFSQYDCGLHQESL